MNETNLLYLQANCKKQPQCEICFRSFKGPGMLKMHMKTHEVSSHFHNFFFNHSSDFLTFSMSFEFLNFELFKFSLVLNELFALESNIFMKFSSRNSFTENAWKNPSV